MPSGDYYPCDRIPAERKCYRPGFPEAGEGLSAMLSLIEPYRMSRILLHVLFSGIVLAADNISAPPPRMADRILIEKSAHKMTLMSGGEVLKTYQSGLGILKVQSPRRATAPSRKANILSVPRTDTVGSIVLPISYIPMPLTANGPRNLG